MSIKIDMTTRFNALDEIYASLPPLSCKRKCQESCGPILMSHIEWKRVVKKIGFKPKGRRDLVCPLLRNGDCRVYEIRPLICRLWGIVEKMSCPHGCMPDRWVADNEVADLIKRINELEVHSDNSRK